MPPTFLALFKRGRYNRPGDQSEEALNNARAGKRSETERFSVAALAFCLKHAPAFRACFFRCALLDGVNHSAENTPIPQIDVEPNQWADLLIQTSAEVFLIECKIDAAIVGHQNPWATNSAFWQSDTKPKGYGAEFAESFSRKAKHFRLLHQNPEANSFVKNQKNGITLVPVRWTDLNNSWIENKSTAPLIERELIADLFDSLGQLGVKTFGHRITNTMKAESPENAAQCGKILSDAAGKIDLDNEAWSFDVNWQSFKEWKFGVDVLAYKKGKGALTQNHEHLRDVIRPSAEWLCWFGYDRNADHPGNDLGIWLYCGNPGNADKVLKKLEGLPSGQYSVKRDDDGVGWHNIIVQGANRGSDSDRHWFVSVFEQLGIPSV